MTSKSTITRERTAKIKSWRETYGAGSNVMLPAEEAEELACLALAAMDSTASVELPLDYLQGHKDGLEWAAKLAKPITLKQETGFTMTLSSWQKLFAKVQMCCQRSRQWTASRWR